MNGKQSAFKPEGFRDPINRQAAGVFRRAYWDEMPLVHPKIIPSPYELSPERLAEVSAKIKAIREKQEFWDACEQTKRQLQKQQAKTRVKIATCRVHSKNLLRAIHKRKGLPPPSFSEIAAFQKTLPLYGQKS